MKLRVSPVIVTIEGITFTVPFVSKLVTEITAVLTLKVIPTLADTEILFGKPNIKDIYYLIEK